MSVVLLNAINDVPGENRAGPLAQHFSHSQLLPDLLHLGFFVGRDQVFLEDVEDAPFLPFFVELLALLLGVLIVDHPLQLQVLAVGLLLERRANRLLLRVEGGRRETALAHVLLAEELLMLLEEVRVELLHVVLALFLALLPLLVPLLYFLHATAIRELDNQGFICILFSAPFYLISDKLTFHLVCSLVAAVFRVWTHDYVFYLPVVLLLVALGHVGSLIVRRTITDDQADSGD